MRNSSVLVLCYHRVNVLKMDTNLLAVSPENFKKHMEYLKDTYRIVRFEDNWRQLEDEKAVVITFDDGYLDNYQNALPILEELEIPATVFVSTGTMSQQRELWWDELENLLIAGWDFPESFHLKDEVYECIWDTHSSEMRKNCYEALHHLMKDFIDVQKRNNWMNQLWEWRGNRPEARKENLTVDKIICKNLGKSKWITIGAHTITHPSLGALGREAQKAEIEGSLRCLEEILQEKITLFSYPFGMKNIDFSEETIQLCKEAGIKKAAAAYGGVWNETIDDYSIPRNGIRNMTLDELKNRLEDLWKGKY